MIQRDENNGQRVLQLDVQHKCFIKKQVKPAET